MGSENEPFDPKRRLCTDGACIGIIGNDGCCTVCHLADSAEEPAFLTDDLIQEATPTPAVSPIDSQVIPPAIHRRRLCEDGTCTGILDIQGKCGTCGKIASSTLVDTSPTREQEPAGTR